MDRRTFLGSVIGTVAGLQFRALSPNKPTQMKEIYPFKMLFKGNGCIIQAPSIKEIKRTKDSFMLEAEPLDMNRSIIIDKLLILDSKGKLLAEASFNNPANLACGDIFTATYTINFDPVLFGLVKALEADYGLI